MEYKKLCGKLFVNAPFKLFFNIDVDWHDSFNAFALTYFLYHLNIKIRHGRSIGAEAM